MPTAICKTAERSAHAGRFPNCLSIILNPAVVPIFHMEKKGGQISTLILLKKTDFVIRFESEPLILSHLRNTIFRKSGFFSRIKRFDPFRLSFDSLQALFCYLVVDVC